MAVASKVVGGHVQKFHSWAYCLVCVHKETFIKMFAAACPSREWMTKLYYSYTMEYNTACVSIDKNLIIAMLGETYTL